MEHLNDFFKLNPHSIEVYVPPSGPSEIEMHTENPIFDLNEHLE
jgi:hypothetical protein